MQEFCAGIVTYNPKIERLRENIESIVNQVQMVIIFDNGSVNFKFIEELTNTWANIVLIKENQNRGIAYALNRIFECATMYEDIKWVLTLDQDSICPDNIIQNYQKFCHKNVGIISPIFRDPRVNYGSQINGKDVIEVENCITSGALTSIEAWKKTDGFDEIMFIDYVDYDFCCRLRKAGYKILQLGTVVLNHTIGNSKEITFLGKKIITTNHSNMRKYYIARNYLYYRHKNQITDSAQRKAMCNKIIKTLVFEKGRIGSAYAFFRGWADGHRMMKGREPKGWTN